MERIIYNESRGNPSVGFNKTRYSAGIAQISKAVWRSYSKLPYSEAANPQYFEQNIDIAAKYLRENYLRFGNWKDALMAYNVGPTALQNIKKGKRKLPLITQNYINGF